jgi:hypothetical protein
MRKKYEHGQRVWDIKKDSKDGKLTRPIEKRYKEDK